MQQPVLRRYSFPFVSLSSVADSADTPSLAPVRAPARRARKLHSHVAFRAGRFSCVLSVYRVDLIVSVLVKHDIVPEPSYSVRLRELRPLFQESGGFVAGILVLVLGGLDRGSLLAIRLAQTGSRGQHGRRIPSSAGLYFCPRSVDCETSSAKMWEMLRPLSRSGVGMDIEPSSLRHLRLLFHHARLGSGRLIRCLELQL